jgi:hypothetical protein
MTCTIPAQPKLTVLSQTKSINFESFLTRSG